MFAFFDTRPQNFSPVQVDNTTFSFLFLMLSMFSLFPNVDAQHGGGGFGGGGGFHGGGGYYGGGSHFSSGECGNDCLMVFGGVFGGLIAFVCVGVILSCIGNNREIPIDYSLILDCPYDNPQQWITSADVTIPVSIEHSNIIENLKLNPNMLNKLWEGIYTEPGRSGRFNPKLIFDRDAEKNLMAFKTIEDEQDDYGDYRIRNGMFSFESGRFVAHKEYFRPSQQSAPYTIVQAGYIEFEIENEQIALSAKGSWYSTYNNSVQGTFEYNKTIPGLTLADKCESYGTFENRFANP